MTRWDSVATVLAPFVVAACSGSSKSDPSSAPLAVCDPLDAGVCPSMAPSFQNDVMPVLNADCNSTCHGPGMGQWELADWNDVSDWASLIKLDLEDCAMPPVDAGAFATGDRTLILNWIACGAPNN